MQRPAAGLCLLFALAAATGPRAQELEKPIDLGLVEKARVRMVILDVIVLDRERRTVPGLTAADFEVTVGGKEVSVASLDVDCPSGGAEDPMASYRTGDETRHPPPPGHRRIVLAFDYLHLDPLQRTDVLERAKKLIEGSAGRGDEVLVAALTGGLRVEQPFTTDLERTRRTLQRMEYDITLWNGNFYHQSEEGFVRGLGALFDVLGTVAGPKAVVLYSGMQDVPLDGQFRQIAALAAGARCSIYPVDARGLASPPRGGASPTSGPATGPGSG